MNYLTHLECFPELQSKRGRTPDPSGKWLMEGSDVAVCPSTAHSVVVAAGFYHFAFEAGSPTALAQKREELRAKGVEVTDIADHKWARSIYFKDPNGLSLEYCCVVRNPAEDDTAMHGAFTVRRAALELGNAINTEVSIAKSVCGKRKA